MLLHQRDNGIVISVVGIMEVSLVNKDHRLVRCLGDKVAQVGLGRNSGGGIVRIAHVNQAAFRGGKHFWKVVSETARQRNLEYLSAVDARLLYNRFKRGVGHYELPAFLAGERFSAEFQNLAGPIPKQDV